MNEQPNSAINLIGVISDTHNLLRPEAVEALEGADLIIHAGDICQPQILEELKVIAPVIAVRGNNDKGTWTENLPAFETVKIGETLIYIIHDLKELEIDRIASGVRIVISGHSHKPSVREEQGIIYLNPGSAGPKRFKLPLSVARIRLKGETVNTEIVELKI